MIFQFLCALTGHIWDYDYEHGFRVCQFCEKLEKLPNVENKK